MKRILSLFLAMLFLFSCSNTEHTYIDYEEEYNIAQSYIDELESDLEYWMSEADYYEQVCSDLLSSLSKTSHTKTILKSNELWECDDFEIMFWMGDENSGNGWREGNLHYKFKESSSVEYYAVFYYDEHYDLYEIMSDSLIGELGKIGETSVDSHGYTQDYYYDFYYNVKDILASEDTQPNKRHYYIVVIVNGECHSAIFTP